MRRRDLLIASLGLIPSPVVASTIITRGAASAMALGFGTTPNGTGPQNQRWNPAFDAAMTYSAGNTTAVNNNSSNFTACRSNTSFSGKAYAEWTGVNATGTPTCPDVGFGNSGAPNNNYIGAGTSSIGYSRDGSIIFGGSTILTVATWTDGDVVMGAYDAASGKFWVGKNGTWLNSGNPAAGTGNVGTGPTGTIFMLGSAFSSGQGMAIQTAYTYAAPSGFSTL